MNVVDQESILMEEDLLFDIGWQFVSECLDLDFKEQIVVIVLQEIFDVILELRLYSWANTEFLKCLELRIETFLLHFVINKHGGEWSHDHWIECNTYEHPDAGDSYLIVVVRSKITISYSC